jgi:hypothetical protein
VEIGRVLGTCWFFASEACLALLGSVPIPCPV